METLQNMIMTGMATQGHALSPEQVAALAAVLGQAPTAPAGGLRGAAHWCVADPAARSFSDKVPDATVADPESFMSPDEQQRGEEVYPSGLAFVDAS